MAATNLLAACVFMAAHTYNVPPALLAGIYKAEGGKPGLAVSNTNDTHDLGPMQINTLWIPELAQIWGVDYDTAKKRVRDNMCINVDVAAWILSKHIRETKNLTQSLQHYHSRTPKFGKKYKKRVIELMKKNRLLKTER